MGEPGDKRIVRRPEVIAGKDVGRIVMSGDTAPVMSIMSFTVPGIGVALPVPIVVFPAETRPTLVTFMTGHSLVVPMLANPSIMLSSFETTEEGTIMVQNSLPLCTAYPDSKTFIVPIGQVWSAASFQVQTLTVLYRGMALPQG